MVLIVTEKERKKLLLEKLEKEINYLKSFKNQKIFLDVEHPIVDNDGELDYYYYDIRADGLIEALEEVRESVLKLNYINEDEFDYWHGMTIS